MQDKLKYLVVGAGFSGGVIAERIASVRKEKVLLIDKRATVGGNSYSAVDVSTGIECHTYGSHIFHTSERKVWNYIRPFADFTSYRHKVMIRCGGKCYFMPINLKTLDDFYQLDLSPQQAEKLIAEEIAKSGISAPRNLEEKAISLIGRPLYKTFISGYTHKQWGQKPALLPAEIITRLPVRTNFNTDYFNDPWQGVPVEGYGKLFCKLLENPLIEVKLNTDFRAIRSELPADCKIIYTGMIDEFFDHSLGKLEWRSLRFEWETLPLQDFQGTTVVNYGDEEVPYTRIHEFKHYHPERQAVFDSKRTIICREYPQNYQAGKEAYYPVNNEPNQRRFAEYQELANKNPNVIFCGRLGCYQYWDMDKAVLSALRIFDQKINVEK